MATPKLHCKYVAQGFQYDPMAFGGMLEKGYQRGGEFWVEQCLPRHFQEGAEFVYHYRKRTTKYLEQKKKKVGHQMPLVYSGDLREAVIQGHRVHASRRALAVVMQAPGYVKFHRKGYEVTAVLKREVEALGKVVDGTVADELRKKEGGSAAMGFVKGHYAYAGG